MLENELSLQRNDRPTTSRIINMRFSSRNAPNGHWATINSQMITVNQIQMQTQNAVVVEEIVVLWQWFWKGMGMGKGKGQISL